MGTVPFVIYLLPSPYSNAAGGYQYNADATRVIKEQLYDLNAVTIGFTADTFRPTSATEKDGEYISTETWAHYTWKYEMPNHAVTIVGWDDNYPKEKQVDRGQIRPFGRRGRRLALRDDARNPELLLGGEK